MRGGELEVFSLSDGVFRLDGGAMFGVVPKVLWQMRAPADELNRIGLGLRPVLVRAGPHNVLIDAGIGDKMPQKLLDLYGIDRPGSVIDSLAVLGLRPEDIDTVIATHLHFDHAGGFTRREGGLVRPTFPRASYFVRRGEWRDALESHERNHASYRAEDFMPLIEAGQVEFVDEDGEIVPGISVERTGGHTEHHQMVRIASAGQVALFLADLVPTVAHVDLAWIMSYDLYPVETLRAKKRLLAEALEGEYVIFFEHDPVVPAGILRRDGRRLRVEPVPITNNQ